MSQQPGFTVASIFERVWGIKFDNFDPEFQNPSANQLLAKTGKYGSPFYGRDGNGREYYLPVKISYPEETGNAQGAVGDAGGGISMTTSAPVGRLVEWWLPYPVVSIIPSKIFVDTPLTYNDPLTEFIGFGFVQINIKGLLINRNNEFPEADFSKLMELWRGRRPVHISNPVTDIALLQRTDGKPSDEVVIRDLRFPDARGVKHVRPYELTLYSNNPFNLIKSPKK